MVTFVSMSGNGSTRDVTYYIPPPTGGWKHTVNGTYAIAVRSNQVSDTAGNTVAAGSIGLFTVNIPKPDYAGNTLASAKSLGAVTTGTIRIAEDGLHTLDRNDYYKITVTSTISVNVKLTGLTDNADISLHNSAGTRIAHPRTPARRQSC